MLRTASAPASRGWVVAFVVLLVAVCTAPAEAYLDPGTGSYLFQMLAAAVVSAGFVVKAYWARIREFFRRRSAPPPDGR